MEMSQIVAEIDAEIQRLQQARNLLSAAGTSSASSAPTTAPSRKTAPAKATKATKSAGGKRKRNLSPEGRARIQEALRKRWEEHRKSKG